MDKKRIELISTISATLLSLLIILIIANIGEQDTKNKEEFQIENR